MKILITGATGFIGSNILKALVKEGHEITVVSATGTENSLPKVHKVCYLGLEGLNWVEAYGKDVVIHQAANNDTLSTDEGEMYRANVFGPIKLFHSALDGGCKKFIYASSTAVYGAEPAPYREDETHIKPLNVYGESKASFDTSAMRFAKDHDVSVIGLRYCNIYGPGEAHKGHRASMIYQLIQQLTTKHQVSLFRDGEQKRDWMHVDDVVGANIAALHSSGVSGIFNCGTGTATTFKELVGITISLLRRDSRWEGQRFDVNYIDNPNEDAYQSHTECDTKKLREELAYIPQFDVKSGIEAYLKELAIL